MTDTPRCPASQTHAPNDFSGTCPLCGVTVHVTALGDIPVHIEGKRATARRSGRRIKIQ